MKIINSVCIFSTLIYFGILTCSVIGWVDSFSFMASITLIYIPIIYLWLRARKIRKTIGLINHEITTAASTNKLLVDTPIKNSKRIQDLIANVNHLIDRLYTACEYADHMKAETEELTKENSQLSKRLIKNNVLAHAVTSATTESTPTNTVITNHIVFNELVNKSISSSKRKNKLFALLVINVRTKKASDAASNLQEQFAHDISGTLRTDDIIAYFNDEIFILLNDIGKTKFASIVAEKILGVSKKKNAETDADNNLIVNIGICSYPDDGDSIKTLFENASNALFKSTQMGKNAYEYHSDKMSTEAREYIQLESALKSAIHNRDVSLYYQPKLEVKSASITGVEALMRWEHPVLGIIRPDTFISIAEETGSFMRIAEIALFDACMMNKSWQSEGLEHITVSVNISPKQFTHPDLPDLLKRVTNSTQLDPAYLELEISESTIMQDVDAAAAILIKLKETGVKISIDHFGTGFTSISFLKKFPINTIKIDRSFIAGIPNNPNDMSITSAFIALAHNLGIQVVAEGVETMEQVQYLISQKCDLIQGFFLSHPVHASKISSQLKKLNNEVELK